MSSAVVACEDKVGTVPPRRGDASAIPDFGIMNSTEMANFLLQQQCQTASNMAQISAAVNTFGQRLEGVDRKVDDLGQNVQTLRDAVLQQQRASASGTQSALGSANVIGFIAAVVYTYSTDGASPTSLVHFNRRDTLLVSFSLLREYMRILGCDVPSIPELASAVCSLKTSTMPGKRLPRLCVCPAFAFVPPLRLPRLCVCPAFASAPPLRLPRLCVCPAFAFAPPLRLPRLCVCPAFAFAPPLRLPRLCVCPHALSRECESGRRAQSARRQVSL
jgi:hypothetical protein